MMRRPGADPARRRQRLPHRHPRVVEQARAHLRSEPAGCRPAAARRRIGAACARITARTRRCRRGRCRCRSRAACRPRAGRSRPARRPRRRRGRATASRRTRRPPAPPASRARARRRWEAELADHQRLADHEAGQLGAVVDGPLERPPPAQRGLLLGVEVAVAVVDPSCGRRRSSRGARRAWCSHHAGRHQVVRSRAGAAAPSPTIQARAPAALRASPPPTR